MFAVVICEDNYLDFYKQHLISLKVDLSNIISPKELSPLASDIYNNYLLKRADAVIILTPKDSFNFYISKVCKTHYEINKIITVVNNSDNKEIFQAIGVKDILDFNYFAKEAIDKYLNEEKKACI